MKQIEANTRNFVNGSTTMNTILYLEDDLDIVKTVMQSLRPYNVEVINAPSGIKGFERIVALKPDLILLGLMTLQTDNWEMHAKIRQAEELKDIPIIMITDKLQSSVYDKTPGPIVPTPFDDYIGYPFEGTVLWGIIDVLLSKR